MVCGSGVILATKNVCYFDDLQCTSIYIVDDFCAAGDMRWMVDISTFYFYLTIP